MCIAYIALMSADLSLPVVNSWMPPLKDRTYSFPCTERRVIRQSRKCGERCIDLIALPSLNSRGSRELGSCTLPVRLSASSSGAAAWGAAHAAVRSFSFCHDHPVFRRIVTTTLVSRATARAAFNGAECSRKAASWQDCGRALWNSRM